MAAQTGGNFGRSKVGTILNFCVRIYSTDCKCYFPFSKCTDNKRMFSHGSVKFCDLTGTPKQFRRRLREKNLNDKKEKNFSLPERRFCLSSFP
jgi:hypothetical protein